MRQYEVIYILNAGLDEEANTALVNKFSDLIANQGGEITKTDIWGKRRLAYEIDDLRDGFYVVLKFKGESAVAKELDRVFRITDGVLRYIIIREDE
ncbi:MAG: 30S ribosomal protein S6 [Eubacteriales bacterium]|nr:30S ribosomal protein S6 [Bacillota bacterium]MBV1727564.1 30S ribosomal protein S6 [Desulforudis sp.]MDP3050141.1 30S ribosomal protein S6 [Eubacteriales bacterium]MBU4534132.1 30S ribosomal protein S6 [Bacillota bacterium]MBU4553378.1 30S ribosomal protein S6 [Bacillota bacterium]